MLWSEGPNRFVESRLADVSPGTALDVACGEGRNAVWLAARGWDVTGVDFSSVALDRARDMALQRGVTVDFVQADVTDWEPAQRFDLVLVAYLHLLPAVLESVMARCVAWVAPGGRLFGVAHDRRTAGVSGPSDPDLLWTPDLATRWADPLEVEEARSVERVTAEGAVTMDTILVAVRPQG